MHTPSFPVWLPVAAGCIGMALACGSPVSDTADTASCSGGCTGTLTLEIGTDSFQIVLYSEQFSTLQVACPDAITAGGSGTTEITCTDTGVEITISGMAFPETMTLSVDGGNEAEITPDWEPTTVCGETCTSATYAP